MPNKFENLCSKQLIYFDFWAHSRGFLLVLCLGTTPGGLGDHVGLAVCRQVPYLLFNFSGPYYILYICSLGQQLSGIPDPSRIIPLWGWELIQWLGYMLCIYLIQARFPASLGPPEHHWCSLGGPKHLCGPKKLCLLRFLYLITLWIG